MATPQLSPGVLVREVDLTVGRADNVLDNIGAIAGPFPIGPVDYPVDITTEQELINVFGKPLSTDAQYEYWMSASSFLSYGGVLKVVRTGGTTLNNANAGVGAAYTTALDIDNYDDYINNHTEANDYNWAAKNPGSWANSLKVCVIDDLGDQIIGITTTSLSSAGAQIGFGVTAAVSGTLAGSGSTSNFTGYLKGIITGVSTNATTSASTITVKILSRVSSAGTETEIDYAEGASFNSFDTADSLYFVNNAGINTGLSATSPYTPATVTDWYENQTLGLTNSTVYWRSIAPKPTANQYSLERNGKGDGIHVVVVDDLGTITGIQGNILEKHLSLSKALDSISSVNSPQKIWYEQYIADFSSQVYAGGNPSSAADSYWGTAPRATGFTTYSGVKTASFTPITTSDGLWGQNAQDKTFSAIGNVTYTLGGGVDYSAAGGMKATLGNLQTSYDLFSNKDEIAADYLIMGPGLTDKADSQAKASYLISIAEQRKDCVATIGPHRADLVGLTNTTTQTNNLINFFSSLPSSSYAVFDSGYKYTYDRFNNKFRYIPCNGDVAGLMTRTNIVAYPWFSPAGQQRGIINNAVKLAYNPNKTQRDKLYPQRINAIVTQPGIGTLLFGDKTALGYASAFDRINVRRLFLTIEQALQRAAQAQLFELNDELTRANFRNIVEPYLRDVEAKRGLYGFLVVCDSSNNTPDVIDNNEFRADIFLKPAKSINYVTLTFVATRTGVSFEEVAGTV
jgi:Phage tail sheath protein subtilisin-like domain/Phage tail sheath C-terminal domain